MPRKNLILLALAFLAPLTAAKSLDQLMPSDIQRRTGVVNLTKKQKEALAHWLSENLPEDEQAPSRTAERLTLSENLHGGKIIRLSDGSTWEVNPRDVSRAQVWLFPFPIRIEKNDSSTYPYRLVNANTNKYIRVRKVP